MITIFNSFRGLESGGWRIIRVNSANEGIRTKTFPTFHTVASRHVTSRQWVLCERRRRGVFVVDEFDSIRVRSLSQFAEKRCMLLLGTTEKRTRRGRIRWSVTSVALNKIFTFFPFPSTLYLYLLPRHQPLATNHLLGLERLARRVDGRRSIRFVILDYE